jgi:two-component system, sensor histidine kinase and response regulator
VDDSRGSKGKLVMTTIRDMSQWLELERSKQMNTMKTIAFASAAHEFRNPLNGIVASLELLEDKIDHERGTIFYNTAKNCTKLMLYLVRDILDFSQIESKSFILNYAQVNMKEIFDDCVNLFSFKAREKAIQLEWHYD